MGVKATVMPIIHIIYYQLVTDSLLPSILQVLCFISETKIFIRITTELLAFLQREEIQTRRANGLKTRDEFKRIQLVVFCSHSRNTPFAKQNNIASVSYFFPFLVLFFFFSASQAAVSLDHICSKSALNPPLTVQKRVEKWKG